MDNNQTPKNKTPNAQSALNSIPRAVNQGQRRLDWLLKHEQLGSELRPITEILEGKTLTHSALNPRETKVLRLRRALDESEANKLNTNFLSNDAYDTLITGDTDAYDLATGALLFRFRKRALPDGSTLLGYQSFEKSIDFTEGRGSASGEMAQMKTQLADGTYTNTTLGGYAWSGNVGYMDNGAMVRYCRKTAFARKYFDEFTAGIPFVEAVDKLYAELCPEQYGRQKAIALGTNRNYVIADTSFTTVTVNENFQTAVHKDSGDLPQGFGNLCVYRRGHYDGGFFCLPEWRVAVDLHTDDMLFVDVHRWHGNTPFYNAVDPAWKRIAFVMYYREYMYRCKQPSEELHDVQMEQGGFLKL